MFDKFSAKHGHRRVDQMKRQHVDLLIASMADRPGAANSFLKRLKKLMVFAISRGWITSDPTYRMKGFKAGEIHTWTEAQISQFESHWPVGTKQRLAFALHLYTGQRRSDVHRMTWADYDGEGILVTQQKTEPSSISRSTPSLNPSWIPRLNLGIRSFSRNLADRSQWLGMGHG